MYQILSFLLPVFFGSATVSAYPSPSPFTNHGQLALRPSSKICGFMAVQRQTKDANHLEPMNSIYIPAIFLPSPYKQHARFVITNPLVESDDGKPNYVCLGAGPWTIPGVDGSLEGEPSRGGVLQVETAARDGDELSKDGIVFKFGGLEWGSWEMSGEGGAWCKQEAWEEVDASDKNCDEGSDKACHRERRFSCGFPC
ncbi:hypothetical protein B0J11DRAFT_563752 [Dendryphion nanum]|uniref:Uncharacterized protein n=1 Tax=Dendryphion nanum TaxID=256645 RepID=A0A9P9EKP1_9PLEO|nr:hypothetical protein B0J11DRAFT_563752 [Dendryphion nanum]